MICSFFCGVGAIDYSVCLALSMLGVRFPATAGLNQVMVDSGSSTAKRTATGMEVTGSQR